MWTHEASIDTTASASQVWALLADVAGWKRWNAGIESVELPGPFATGSVFSMTPMGGPNLRSTLIDVRENASFTDETVVDGTRVVVAHDLQPLAAGGTRIVYRTQISGPMAAEFGPMVTGDFPDVLAALKTLAERGA